MTPEEIRRGRWTLLALAALFFVPLFIAFALYYGGGWRPAQATNHGRLLAPPVPIATAWPAEDWTMLYVGASPCDDACRKALYVMRQTRLALAEKATRVQRVYLPLGGAAASDLEFLATEHPGLIVLGDGAPKVLEGLPAGDRKHAIHLVDPLGNLVLVYDARENPKGLLGDLKKLLRLSHIG